jgi:alcohol dehydrogenase (cytochrome c)
MTCIRFRIGLLIVGLAVTVSLDRAGAQAPQGQSFAPVTDTVLNNPAAGDWLRWRRDNTASGYSPLDQVNRQNVRQLRLAWAVAMEAGPQEQEPIVYRGMMYLPHTNGVVQALDARTGERIWEYRRKLPEGLGNDTTRSLAVYQDKIYLTTEDAYLVALDGRTGSLAWETKVGDHTRRINYSSGPIAGGGKIFSGITCGVGTPQACFVSAHDAATGRELWKRSSVAGPGDPPEHEASWGGAPFERRRKASFWLTGSYDPQLQTVYWTTASAYPYPEVHKGTGSGSLLYTNSILAINADTGAIRWFFQMQPRDNFDMDHQDNPILAEADINGVRRKTVYVLGKPGMLWAFDRETGAYLWNRQLVSFQNLYREINPRTGAITMNEDIIPKQIGDAPMVCPGMRGGKLFQTKAYSPQTNAIYGPVSNMCSIMKIVPLTEEAAGVDYDGIVHMEGSGGMVGRLMAVSASTGEVLWTHDQRAAMGSVLATGGNLVFAGDLHRYFRAFDAENGRVLWEIPLSGPVSGYPISYAADGKQYIAVAVGGGTPGQRHLGELYPELKPAVSSNVLMVFALGE